MLTLETALAAVAQELAVSIPALGAGGYVFELADEMRLGVTLLPDASAFIIYSEAAAARPGEGASAAEERAANFLRLHLARLRHNCRVIATRDKEGGLLLFRRIVPETEGEWLAAVADLLNEVEIARRHLAGGGNRSGSTALFSGMAGLFGHGAILR